jgi:hypothetical protein
LKTLDSGRIHHKILFSQYLFIYKKDKVIEYFGDLENFGIINKFFHQKSYNFEQKNTFRVVENPRRVKKPLRG